MPSTATLERTASLSTRQEPREEITVEFTILRRDSGERRATAELRVSGSLDLQTRHAIIDAAAAAFATVEHLEVDAEEVDFIDAAGVAALVEVAALADQRGATFRLTRRSEAVRHVLDVVGTDFPWASEATSETRQRKVAQSSAASTASS